MPSVTYMNQSAPFWDFIASLEQQGNNHPFFSRGRSTEAENGNHHEEGQTHTEFDPWNWGANVFGRQGFPYRGPPRDDGPSHGATGREHESTPYDHDDSVPESGKEKSKDNNNEKNDEEMRDTNDSGEGPSGPSASDNEGCTGGRGRHGRCGGRRRGRCSPGGPGQWGGPWGRGGPHRGLSGGPHDGPRGGPHHGPHHGPRGFAGRGGWGPWGRRGFFGGGAGDPYQLAANFWGQLNDTNVEDPERTTNEEKDHTPDADVFDTENAFVVHISLPGAKKEDVGVNWDAEKSELSVAGVIYRPGDEEFLKTLAMSERKVGPFERKIRLGTRATPAHIDADGITAKLEDGVLRVDVPKLDAGYVEIRKVDIE